ncbi:ras-related protein rab-38-like [Plasmopara halstedii]|uniref:Ras-related protein rab-38-like n=1 Tax=Plasmopara halstedii TaxID=4781 RepID=A0A0P1ABS4_PLAHL|nr:ras-related protein rab-38-like [Plasmopara halstedii]CEG38204.1 ras-related protein rab-38-like [Plasmopara halstedii]|eukprot:XP_024574573.1 ras-related protein rab-38-like [Plasmopara halstedii]
MSEYDDVAAMFSKHSARIIQQHRRTTSNDSNATTPTETNNIQLAMLDSSSQALSQPKAASESLEEIQQQLVNLENAPAPTKEEIDEILAQYSSGSSVSGSDDERPDSSEPETIIMKVLVVGNARCGKTSTIRRFAQDEFNEEYVSTIGVDFMEKVIPYDASLTINLQLWDIAGQDRFAKLTRGYFREARGAVIVCDITRVNTIDAVMNWKNEISTCCKDSNEGKEIPVVVIANKSDLLVDPMGALDLGVNMQKCIDQNNIVEWFRASAKSGERITDAFSCLIDRMVDDFRVEKEKNQHQKEEIGAKEPEKTPPEIIHLSRTRPRYRAVKQKGFACDCN